MPEKDNAAQAVVVGGVGTAFGVALGLLLAGKPVEAAPPEAKWNYLVQLLEQLTNGNLTIIQLLERIEAAQAEPIAVTILTPWVAKDPESIFDQAIRNVGTFDADKMVDFRNGKRLVFKVESSLDQAVNIQVIGNIADSFFQAVNIAMPWPCVANGNISIGLAWDDWHCFVGLRIITAVAPTTGMLKMWAVVQE